MFRKVLVANRGAIACRVIRTLRTLGVESVAVYSDADRFSPHVAQADEAVRIGPATAAQSYLSIDAVLAAAKQTGAEAIHPGYGFLSENPEFADACDASGIVFLGPTGDQMRTFAFKHSARAAAASLGVPLLPGTGLLPSLEEARIAAEAIGYPVMLKSTAGGGGIGIRLCRRAEELTEAWSAVVRQGQSAFGDGGVFLERFIEQARHLEVQIFGDGRGEVVALGERDCSVQRRNQKVIEETPAPGLSPETRARLSALAVALGKSVQYRSAGTVEFVYDDAAKEFYFLEVNTRLQVEHGVTEEVYGVDLVAWMVQLGGGRPAALIGIRFASARSFGRSPAVCRRRGPKLSAEHWAIDARSVSRKRSGRNMGGTRHGDYALLRSDACQGHHDRRGPTCRAGGFAGRAGRDAA